MPRQRKLPPGLTLRGKTYYACFRAGGRLVRKKLSSDLDAAKDMLIEMRSRANKSDFGLLDNDISIAEVRELYEQSWQSLRPGTATRYRLGLDQILPQLPAKRVSQLSVRMLLAYRKQRLAELTKGGKQVSPRTVNIEVTCLTQMLNWAVNQDDLIGSNPLARLKPLETKGFERKERRSLTVEEVGRLFEHSPPHLLPVWRMLCVTGMRRNEVASLVFKDIDFERRVVTVTASNAKTKRKREIQIDDFMFAMLIRLRDEAPFRRPCRGSTDRDTRRIAKAFTKDRVFVTKAGTPWKRNLLTRFYAICKRAGIDDAVPGGAVDIHALRGTFATLAIEGGANPKDVQKLMGHETLEMTMNIYSKATDRGQRAAINALPFASIAPPANLIPVPDVPMARASSNSSLQVVGA